MSRAPRRSSCGSCGRAPHHLPLFRRGSPRMFQSSSRSSRSSRLLLLLLLLTVVGVASCSQCGAPDTPKKPHDSGDRLTPDKDRPPLELSPLPAPPAVEVAPGTLPGVPKGPLAVVVARPQERLRGHERPAITFNKPVVPLGAAEAEMPVPA